MFVFIASLNISGADTGFQKRGVVIINNKMSGGGGGGVAVTYNCVRRKKSAFGQKGGLQTPPPPPPPPVSAPASYLMTKHIFRSAGVDMVYTQQINAIYLLMYTYNFTVLLQCMYDSINTFKISFEHLLCAGHN